MKIKEDTSLSLKGCFEFTEGLIKENEILFMTSLTCPSITKVLLIFLKLIKNIERR
jgi:hypothetical protein